MPVMIKASMLLGAICQAEVSKHVKHWRCWKHLYSKIPLLIFTILNRFD